MIIVATIMMIAGGIAAVTGYMSIVAIHLDTIDGLFEIGLIVFIVGLVMLLVKLVKMSSEKRNIPEFTKSCVNCGTHLKENEQFCHNCGEKIINK